MPHPHIQHLREKMEAAEKHARDFQQVAGRLAEQLDAELVKACSVHPGDVVRTPDGHEMLVDKVTAVHGKIWVHGALRTHTGTWSRAPRGTTIQIKGPDQEDDRAH